MCLHPCQYINGSGGNDDEGRQDQPQMLPIDQFPHPDANDQRRSEGQQARQSRRLAVRRHQEGEHRHDENPEAEACRPFNETGPDRQQCYEQVLSHLVFFGMRFIRPISVLFCVFITKGKSSKCE